MLPDTTAVRPRLRALAARDWSIPWDPATTLRLRLLDDHAVVIADLDAREREASGELHRLTDAAGSTLTTLPGIAARSAAELLVEALVTPGASPARAASPASTAPKPPPASSAEGDDERQRHRLNRGGNRRVNAVIHRMAITQLRCEPRARQIYDDARRRGHTKKEAMRILKRHLSNVIYSTPKRYNLNAKFTVPHRRRSKPAV